MKRFSTILAILLVMVGLSASAQSLVTTTPPILQEQSQGVVLTFHADSPNGNHGLANLPEGQEVYAHIGVLTNLSSSTSDWKYTVTPWPTSSNTQTANTDKNRLTRTDTNTYTLNIGNIREYFGITNTTEHVSNIAIVFRTANGSKEGKTANGEDILVPVFEDGFTILFECDTDTRVFSETTDVTFSLFATDASELTISVNDTEVARANNATSLTHTYRFAEAGSYTVTGKVTGDNGTATETLEFMRPDESLAQPYPGGTPKMGAVKNSDGSVTFCLAAPGKASVMLVPSWDDYEVLAKNMMNYCDYEGNRYFWITVENLPDDEWLPYYYLVDDRYKVADPYAHLVLDCYNDNATALNNVWRDRPRYPSDKLSGIMLAVYRGDIDDYEFSDFEIPAHENLVIYEMLLRDFTGINGSAAGSGTVKRAMERLPYIKSMGFNAIELMPIMEFNGNQSWGYNTNFYMAPDKAYGSPTDYKDFIEECHRMGIAVILDIVFNQSDGLHPWYQMYPITSNPFYNRTAPHDYSVLNDWNQDNPIVQQQWTDAIKYWLEAYNVDGFRFDLVKGLGDNASYSQVGGTEQYNQSRVNRMKRLHAVIKSVKPNGIHINEDLAGSQEETELAEDGQLQWANINYASCQFTMGYYNDANLYRFLSSRDSRPWGSTVSYAESHDEERMAYRNAMYGAAGVKIPEGSDITITSTSLKRLGMLAVQMLLTPGPKMVWQFGELGNGQTTKDANGGNNTGNKIVCWNYLDDPDRVYLKDTYGAMINLRMDNPDLFSQNTTLSFRGLADQFDRTRYMKLTSGDREIIAFLNASLTSSQTIQVPTSIMNAANQQLIWATQGFTPQLVDDGAGHVSVTLPDNSFAVYATANVSGVDEIEAVPSDNPIVVGGNGRIVIYGDYSSAEVYDLAGRAIGSLEVPAGIYIVRVDGHSSKVVVR